MRIVRRVTVSTPEGRTILESTGVRTKRLGHLTFADIDEGTEAWQAFTQRCSDFSSAPRTLFSARDVQIALVCFLRGGKHAGYAIERYAETCPDQDSPCEACGLDSLQTHSVCLQKSLKIDEGVVIRLVNLPGRMLATATTHEAIFAKYGVVTKPVGDRKGIEIPDLVELVFPSFDSGKFDHREVVCSACGRLKYWTEIVGTFPRMENYPASAGTSTRPFGGGAGRQVWYPTFVGGALKEELLTKKVKCELWPVAE